MQKRLNESQLIYTASLTKRSKRYTASNSPSKVPLPPLAKRLAKVDWTEVMKMRQTQSDLNVSETERSFYNERAFETSRNSTQSRFFGKKTTEDTAISLASPASLPRRNKVKLNETLEKTLNATMSNYSQLRLPFDSSLIDRVDEYERTLLDDVNKAETADKIQKELQTWTEFYSELDLIQSSQERAVVARRIAHNSQRLVSRLLDLHNQYAVRCTRQTEAMKETIVALKREVMLALKLKEALTLTSMDRERIDKEIEEMFETGEDYSEFTLKTRKLLDKGESQLTVYLFEVYRELCKERPLPHVIDHDINISSVMRWEAEMKRKFM